MARGIAAQQQRALNPVRPRARPATVGVEQYTQRIRMPLQVPGYAVVVGGTATVTLGPQGVGGVWYPQSVGIATTTGAADSSTCALYVGPLSALSQIGSQSYAGGGDSIGLAVPTLYPGSFLVAVWSGAHNGDQAALTVYGQQDTLNVPSSTMGRG
jgi:hypothetical protein